MTGLVGAGELGARAAGRRRDARPEAGEDPAPTEDDRAARRGRSRGGAPGRLGSPVSTRPSDLPRSRRSDAADWIAARTPSTSRASLEPAAACIGEALGRTKQRSAAGPGVGRGRAACRRSSGRCCGRPGRTGPRFPRAAGARTVRRRGPSVDGPGAVLFVVPNIAPVRARLVASTRPSSAPSSPCTRSRIGSSSRGRGRAPASRELLDDFLRRSRRRGRAPVALRVARPDAPGGACSRCSPERGGRCSAPCSTTSSG